MTRPAHTPSFMAWQAPQSARVFSLAALLLVAPTGCGAEHPPARGSTANQRPVSAQVPAGAEADRAPRYRLTVRIEPERHALVAHATIPLTLFPGGRVEFFLNDSFHVREARVDGVPAVVREGDPSRRLPYVDVAALYEVDPSGTRGESVDVWYEGALPETVAGVNVIREDLVELAIYAAWFPLPAHNEGSARFTYTLEVDFPEAFTVLSSGAHVGEDIRNGRRVDHFETSSLGRDIPLVASPDFRRLVGEVEGTEIIVAFRDMDELAARRLLNEASASFRYFTELLAPPPFIGSLRIINSPRGGWGYSRPGFIVMSEERAIGRLGGAADPRTGLLENQAHEIAHLWFSLADPSTEHDWMNEALAEYAAAIDLQRREGDQAFSALLGSYRDHLMEAAPPRGITETRSSDPFRGASWYSRGALFFVCFDEQVGPLDEVLRGLFRRQSSARGPLTTERLIQLLDASADVPRGYLDRWLRSPSLAPVDECLSARSGGHADQVAYPLPDLRSLSRNRSDTPPRASSISGKTRFWLMSLAVNPTHTPSALAPKALESPDEQRRREPRARP